MIAVFIGDALVKESENTMMSEFEKNRLKHLEI